MGRIIVTVKRKNGPDLCDLELPSEVEAARLAALIASAMHWDKDQAGQDLNYQIEVHPSGRILQAHESLSTAGVWDGSRIVLEPLGTRRMSNSSAFTYGNQPNEQPSPTTGPVVGWHSLGIDLPSESNAGPSGSPPDDGHEQSQSGSGYVWKQLDD